MFRKNLVLILGLIVFTVATVSAQNTYVGTAKCTMCHKGAQFDKLKASKHNLSSQAKDVAGKPECEKCHSPLADFKAEGVSCEVCHGPGSAYKSKPIMMKKADAIAKGLLIPDANTCKRCHDATKVPNGHKEIKVKDPIEISHKKA